MLRYAYFILFVLSFLFSCDFYSQKSKKSLSPLDTIIDLKSVDAFPLFVGCDSIPSRSKQKVCFQIKISEFMYSGLLNHEFISDKSIKDTAFVKIKISKTGVASLDTILLNATIKKQLPLLDSILRQRVAEIPRMKPAIKRSFPVTTIFTLPIIIKN